MRTQSWGGKITKGYFIIDPTRGMLDAFAEVIHKNRINGVFYTKFLGQNASAQIPCLFHVVENTEILKQRELKILCCSEEAVYWLSNNMGEKWKTQFAISYLDLLDKFNFKEYAVSRKLPICKYWKTSDSVQEFPVVGKPSIGFASMGIQFLSSQNECQRYERSFEEEMAKSVVDKYRLKYFPQKENKPIFEENIDGSFYRTAFVVKKGCCLLCFPVKGTKQSTLPGKQYSWVEFEYGHQRTDIYEGIERISNQLINVFNLDDGVYVAEFMATRSGKIYLLEFSPRMVSTRIAKLIQYATGVDLIVVMVCLFLNVEIMSPSIAKDKVILRIERNVEKFDILETGYHEISSSAEMSAHGDSINCKYFKKMEANDE